MRSLLRLLGCLLLAAAVPLQGLAATTMIACTAAPQGGEASAMSGHEQHGAAARSMSNATAQQPAADFGGEATTGDAGTGAKCGACSSCCFATGVPTSLVPLGSMAFDDALPRLAPGSVVAFVSDGLKRPPRPLRS